MKKLLSCFLLAFTTLTQAANSMSINVDTSATQFLVTLPANPTTGYQWTVEDYDKSFLKLLSSRYAAPQTKLMGAGGEMSFTFQLISGRSYPKNTTLVFKYARPWEPQTGTVQKVTVNFISSNNTPSDGNGKYK
ncbi:secreted protein [Legionella lansingensis]|uniref:Secreted protein n=1 Tax=Legionella lansingensis TaxID=45067 RepID=A0A0W0VTQ4_9GAMM|nr:protease inhibitor I42 family protein [Legionella lansingensis]KTD23394.1 secreted protein [Legionella lansingensis]SNV49517.1 secreted protein [Legionella lansingensis]